jgi:hypothetical protein
LLPTLANLLVLPAQSGSETRIQKIKPNGLDAFHLAKADGSTTTVFRHRLRWWLLASLTHRRQKNWRRTHWHFAAYLGKRGPRGRERRRDRRLLTTRVVDRRSLWKAAKNVNCLAKLW